MIGEDKEMTKTILDHALEIIYLLIGEDYAIVKKEDPLKVNSIAKETIGKTPGLKIIEPSSMYEGIKDKKGTTEKIIRIANKIIQMLTRKVLYTSDDFAVYFSIEEWEYLEEHKDHYKNMILDHQDSSQPMDKETPQPLLTPTKEVKNNYSALSNIKKPVDTCVKRSKESEINIDKDGEFQPESEETEPQLNVLVCNNISSYNLRPKICIKMEPSDEDTQDSVVYKYICTDSPQPLRLPQQGVDYEFNEACYIKAEPADGYDEDSQESEMVGDNSREISQPLSSSNVIVEYDDQNACYINVELDSSEDEDSQESLVAEELDKGFMNENYQKNGKQMCEECAKLVNDNPHLVASEIDGSGGDPFRCYVCSKSLRRNNQIERLLKSQSKEKTCPCDVCGRKFGTKSQLARHKTVHTGGVQKKANQKQKNRHSRQTCAECARELKDRPHLIPSQGDDSSDGDPLSCIICSKRLIENRQNKKHSKSLLGEKTYKCDVCGKCFNKKWYLTTHRKIHTGEKPYSCSVCGKAFGSRPQLVRHERIHTGEKPYICPVCGRRFTCTGALAAHKVVHTGEKRYSCPECEQRFTRNSSLVKHSSIHADKKPYICNECGKGYCQYANLVVHQRLHSGEKPYSCKYCGSAFTCKATMLRHQKTHT
ncbi:uncharacterized protein O3C94_015515 isoform 2-T2 [Discoglossus pictus]